MDLTTAVVSALVIFCAYFARGVAGFGSGLIAVPLLALSHPLPLVVPLVVFLDYVGSASQGLKNRSSISWSEIWPLIPFTLLGVGIGLYLLRTVDAPLLSKALGGFVLAFAVYQLLPTPELRGSRTMSAPFGILGGMVGTLFGTGGPFYVIYLNMRGLDKSQMRSTFAANFLIDGAIRLAAFGMAGLFHRDSLIYVAMALPIAAIALFLGGRVHTGLSRDAFIRIISLLLIASGLALWLK